MSLGNLTQSRNTREETKWRIILTNCFAALSITHFSHLSELGDKTHLDWVAPFHGFDLRLNEKSTVRWPSPCLHPSLLCTWLQTWAFQVLPPCLPTRSGISNETVKQTQSMLLWGHSIRAIGKETKTKMKLYWCPFDFFTAFCLTQKFTQNKH